MKKILFAVICLLLTGYTLSGARADDDIKEGKWSITVVSKTTGMPMAVPPQTVTQESCITKKDLIPNKTPPAGCTTPKIEKNGGNVTYQLSCDTDKYKMTLSGNVTYTGDTMSGHSTMEMTAAAMKMQTSAEITGKYLGPCN